MNECNVLHAVLAGDLSPCGGPNAAVRRDPCSWLCSAWAGRPAAAASRSESSPTALWAIRGRREGGSAKKPFVSHLCSELRSTLLTELLGRYAFGHSQPHRTLKAAPNWHSYPGKRPLGITRFTPALSPPSGSGWHRPQCSAARENIHCHRAWSHDPSQASKQSFLIH